MKCPNCFKEIRYSRRYNNKCLECSGSFVFEPKYHPLSLTDTYFLKTVDKLSDNDKVFFTPEQFHFSLNKKRFRKSNLFPFFVCLAVITSLMAVSNSWKTGIPVVFFWLCFLAYKKFHSTNIVKMVQEFSDFDSDVLQPWKTFHKKLPHYLIQKKRIESEELKKKLRGFLLCDKQSIANFLNANQLDEKLSLYITADFQNPRMQNKADLPIFILHDASTEGYEFAERVKNFYKDDRRISDIGLRPSEIKMFELSILRAKKTDRMSFPDLTTEENKWLGKDFYAPLFVLRPAHLLELVTDKIERRFSKTENL